MVYRYKENQDQKETFHEETRGIRQLLILRDSKSKKRELVKLMHGMGMGRMLAIIIVIEGTWLGRERRKCQRMENGQVMTKEVEGG